MKIEHKINFKLWQQFLFRNNYNDTHCMNSYFVYTINRESIFSPFFFFAVFPTSFHSTFAFVPRFSNPTPPRAEAILKFDYITANFPIKKFPAALSMLRAQRLEYRYSDQWQSAIWSVVVRASAKITALIGYVRAESLRVLCTNLIFVRNLCSQLNGNNQKVVQFLNFHKFELNVGVFGN